MTDCAMDFERIAAEAAEAMDRKAKARRARRIEAEAERLRGTQLTLLDDAQAERVAKR